MTEPTQRQYRVYIAGSPDGLGVVKIGRTTNLKQRLYRLRSDARRPDLVMLWSVPGGSATEKALHDEFASLRVKGEWFDFGERDAVLAIQAAVRELGFFREDGRPITRNHPADRKDDRLRWRAGRGRPEPTPAEMDRFLVQGMQWA